MRRVPQYLLIGNGRVATHFQHYFSLLQIPFTTWNRSQPFSELSTRLATVTHILVLIRDDAIEAFLKEHCVHSAAIKLHFSGSLITSHAYGTHPLMSFPHTLYSLEQYQTIPFIIDADAPAFATLLPGLSNPNVRLDKVLKAKYHALCVLSGNFSCLLWQKFFNELETNFNIPSAIAHPYLQQQMQNIMLNSATALTGPLARGDMKTIEKNLLALANDPFQPIYQSFVTAFQKIQEECTA